MQWQTDDDALDDVMAYGGEPFEPQTTIDNSAQGAPVAGGTGKSTWSQSPGHLKMAAVYVVGAVVALYLLRYVFKGVIK